RAELLNNRSQILPRALPKAYTHVPLGKGGIPKKFGKLGQPAVETRSPNLSPPSSFHILGFACEDVRRQVERLTVADFGDKTGVGLPYAAPGRLRPRIRGESRRTKVPLMEKIDLSKPSVSALHYETAMGPPRIATLELLRSASSSRPVVRPSGSGLSGRPKARSPQPGSSGRHTVQPPPTCPLSGRLVSAEDRRILEVDRRMPGSLLRFRYAICLRLRTSS
ncbi:hypothetical protein U1Q18_004130, partial [Sarracenia purpurea var. burkii]